MNLLYWHKRTRLARPSRYILPVGYWRELIILVCGLLLLIPVGIDRHKLAIAGKASSIPRPSDSLVGVELQQINQPLMVRASAYREKCDRLGWYPTGFGLKDHSVFSYAGSYYIASIRLPKENAFAYARSTDLCAWEDLGTVIDKRIRGEWDETFVWAPFVLEDNGVYYMYYTGVRRDFTQSIMLAVSTNPADPGSWLRLGMVLQPDHDGMIWHKGGWADCRDATVLKIGDIYFMYYTGRDVSGPIVGWATAFSPRGPWRDWGATLSLSQQAAMAESPSMVSHAGAYYLLYNNTFQGEEYRIGQTQIGPWSGAFPLPPGWANEIWVGQDGLDYTSFLQGYNLVIEQPSWDDTYTPPRLFIKVNAHQLFFPFVVTP